jgi:Mu transposase, C-terminal domain
MIKDAQVRKLRQFLGEAVPLSRAALRTGMDPKSARKYRQAERLPSEHFIPRTWRTREDPFQDVWPEIQQRLEIAPELQAKTLFDDLQRRFPGRFGHGQLRTLQRKIKAWRAIEGPAKEVFFDQEHTAGELCASDFTCMNDLHVTLAGEPFEHLVYHFVLTYSNWETVTICFSESFESLSQGLQNALWELGGVPRAHRTDRLTAAVNNLGSRDLFQQRYRALLSHYGLDAQAIAPRKAHQNGDAEQSHYRFKTVVAQALMLRGSHDFDDRAAYERFLRELLTRRNAGRNVRFAEERPRLSALPTRRLDAWDRRQVRVTQGSTIRIGGNIYSVPSQLIGEHVIVHVMTEYLEVWYGSTLVARPPRLRGRSKCLISYRHVIEFLVRKPGAFAAYRYRDEMFPTSRFRRVYDLLLQQHPARAARDYLRILELAAKQSESGVDAVLDRLLESGAPITPSAVEDQLAHDLGLPRAMEVFVATVDLAMYDQLLETEETKPLEDHPTYTNA